MARTWLCRCGHRNERAHRKCRGEGCGRTRPARRRPAHAHALDIPYGDYVRLNELVHGVDEHTCAICGDPGPEDMRLNRDHAHHSGGYPRGLVHFRCNAILGELERGRDDTETLLLLIHAYLRRSRLHFEQQEAV